MVQVNFRRTPFKLVLKYVLLHFPHSKITYTMVPLNFRPTPFKLVIKLNIRCLNMADERQIMVLSNASNCNLENALTLNKTEDNLYVHIHL